MKAQEKELIYNLLKAASGNFYGYTSPVYQKSPCFTDDKIIEKPVSPSFTQTEKKENIKSDSVLSLSEKIKNCQRCPLHSTRTNVVPGMGVIGSSVLVIGEGPGEEEDKQGLPFVGPAGQLLDKMLAAIQLDRNKNCYIANVVKCRPPYNRDPKPEEALACKSFLDAQIHLLKPKIILALGKVAVKNLLNIQEEFSLNKYRKQIFEYNNVPLIVTYHPSALLRNIEFKKPAWEDLKFFKSELEKLCPDYAKDFIQ